MSVPLEIVGAVFVSIRLVIVALVSVGAVAKTKLPPVPVSSVIAVFKFAEDGVAKKVATLVPRPETPVDIGKPVHEVKVPLEGVPRIGVIKVGDVSESVSPLCNSCTVVVFTTNGYRAAMFSPR